MPQGQKLCEKGIEVKVFFHCNSIGAWDVKVQGTDVCVSLDDLAMTRGYTYTTVMSNCEIDYLAIFSPMQLV